MTYSVVAMGPAENLVGVAVASRFIAVGAVVPWARHGTGALATQSYANYTFGPEGLNFLSEHNAKETLKILLEKDPEREKRQVGIIDRNGMVASFTGKECLDYAGSIEGENFTVQGNILTGRNVLESMASEMEKNLPFIERMIRALIAGEDAGGDSRGKQAAAILIAGKNNEFVESSGIVMNLRIDDHPDPVRELARISKLWQAVHWDVSKVKIVENAKQIDLALRKLGYSSLKEWGTVRGLDHNISGDEIGTFTLDYLLRDSRSIVYERKSGK